MKKPLLVYLAGKYFAPSDGERLRNTDKIIDIAIQVYERSNHTMYPHVPHLTHWIEKRMDYLGHPPRSNEYWYEFDNIILPRCDVLLKCSAPKESTGADKEEMLAKSLGIPVVYSLDELFALTEKL